MAKNSLVYWSADTVLTGHSLGRRNFTAITSWNLHQHHSATAPLERSAATGLFSQLPCESLGDYVPRSSSPSSPASTPHQAVMPAARKPRYLLESLVEVSLLEQLKDVSLLRLEIQVSRGDRSPGCRAHRLDDARGDSCLLLLHSQAHFSFNDSLHLGQNRLLHAKKTNQTGISENKERRDSTAQSLHQQESPG